MQNTHQGFLAASESALRHGLRQYPLMGSQAHGFLHLMRTNAQVTRSTPFGIEH
jgi:hypothetical protein